MHDRVVVVGAQQDSDGGGVRAGTSEAVIDDGLELPDLQLDDDLPQLLDVEVDLASDVGEAAPELEQRLLKSAHQGRLYVFLAGSLGQVQEVEDLPVLGEFLGEFGVRFGQVPGEVRGRRNRTAGAAGR